jgi:periplasmic divalent cation tolerance protein
MTLLAVYTTVASREEALTMAKALVERRLAACAQITEIESVYRWDGAVRHEPEFRILFKTVVTRYAEVEAAIRELHSYELPAIYALAVEQADARYASWVKDEVREELE